MTVYNSGAIDKYVRLEDIYNPSQLDFKERIYDPDRFVCWYDTPAYQRMIRDVVSLVEVDPLLEVAPQYVYPHNETYDLNHYIATNTGCALMYDTTSYEYTNYMRSLEAMSQAYVTYFLAQYDGYKAALESENVSLSKAYEDADAYMDSNQATIIANAGLPPYDPTAIGVAVQSCYEDQIRDRLFYDSAAVVPHTLASATAAALETSAELTQRCLDI